MWRFIKSSSANGSEPLLADIGISQYLYVLIHFMPIEGARETKIALNACATIGWNAEKNIWKCIANEKNLS